MSLPIKKNLEEIYRREVDKLIDLAVIRFTFSDKKDLSSSSDSFESHCKNYINLLLKKGKEKAFNYVIDLIKNGIFIRDIYLKIFRDVLYQTGFM